MDAKNKNILIGGLLAIVLVMAVGYAAFATQLQINGTAEITSSWNVHFKANGHTVTPTAGLSGATAPATTKAGTTNATDAVVYSNDYLTATIYTGLNQPGDTVQYDFTIINEGSLKAQAGTPTLSVTGADYTSQDGLTARKGHIQYQITQLPTPTSISQNGEAEMTLTVTYVNTAAAGEAGSASTGDTGNQTTTESASATVTLTYSQDTSSSGS